MKDRYRLGSRNCQPRARASIVRRNLKEAGLGDEKFPMGKVPALPAMGTTEQKSHMRLTWDGRLSGTKENPILPESHTVDAAVAE